jgi:hypothetical protein
MVYLEAPATQANLSDLAQAMHAMRGHLDPRRAAEEVLAKWPFETLPWTAIQERA